MGSINFISYMSMESHWLRFVKFLFSDFYFLFSKQNINKQSKYKTFLKT
jgi:hypothetical protein